MLCGARRYDYTKWVMLLYDTHRPKMATRNRVDYTKWGRGVGFTMFYDARHSLYGYTKVNVMYHSATPTTSPDTPATSPDTPDIIMYRRAPKKHSPDTHRIVGYFV